MCRFTRKARLSWYKGKDVSLSMLKKLLWWPYQAWCGFTFVFFVILGFLYAAPIYALFGAKAHRVTFTYYRWWARTWFFISGINYRVEGREHFTEAPAIIVSNHSSHLDLLNGAGSAPLMVKALAKSSLKKIPFLGFLFATASVFVDRSSKESRERSMAAMLAAVKQGFSLFLFPEGTRNRSPYPLGPFYDGAFRLAVAAGCPIQPMVILHARFLMPMKGISLRPGTIRAIYLPSISTKGLTDKDVPALKAKVYDDMETLIRAREKHVFPYPPTEEAAQ